MSLKTIPFFGKSGTSRMVRRRRSAIDSMAADITSREVGKGIARAGSLPDLEVEVRTGGAPRHPDLGDGRSRLHAVAVLHQDRAVVGVERDERAGVAEDHDGSVAGLVAGVDHLARRGGADQRSLGRGEVDAVVALPLLHAESAVEHSLDRPLERGAPALARKE